VADGGIGHNGGPPLLWEPQPGPQSLAVAAQFVTELMFGGARGGGKSDYLLGDFLQDIDIGPEWAGIIFRKSYPELEELIKRAKIMYAPYGVIYKVADKTFVFPSGATLKMRHVDTEDDCDKYQGHQYAWIGWDELTNWPNLNSYKKLKACLRNGAIPIPFKRIRCSANPGGVGHHAVKAYFVDPCPIGMELLESVELIDVLGRIIGSQKNGARRACSSRRRCRTTKSLCGTIRGTSPGCMRSVRPNLSALGWKGTGASSRARTSPSSAFKST
jgi:hypothetical protein